eukprot:ANDGO_05888.mRNA.1 hypothetical protein
MSFDAQRAYQTSRVDEHVESKSAKVSQRTRRKDSAGWNGAAAGADAMSYEERFSIEFQSKMHLSFLLDDSATDESMQVAVPETRPLVELRIGDLHPAFTIWNEPLPHDSAVRSQYKAAGIVAFRKDMSELLLVVERRYRDARKTRVLGSFLNVPGGKRDHDDRCPEFSALRELYEETFQNLHSDQNTAENADARAQGAGLPQAVLIEIWRGLLTKPSFVSWIPSSKYVLFGVEVPSLDIYGDAFAAPFPTENNWESEGWGLESALGNREMMAVWTSTNTLPSVPQSLVYRYSILPVFQSSMLPMLFDDDLFSDISVP